MDWLSRPLKPNDFASGTAATGKKATISGASGKSAASGSRRKLAELLSFVGMEVFGGDGEGFALTREEFACDKLELSDSDKERLEAQCQGFVDFLG